MNGLPETLWTRYGLELLGVSSASWIMSVMFAILLVVALRPWPPRWQVARRPVSYASLLLLTAACLFWAWNLKWISDDAFISFRYANNWVDGHGLVFNPGERVEGYTNFLWTALVALGILIGISPGWLTVALGLGSLAANLLLTAQIAALLGPRRSAAALPIGSFLLGANYLFINYGTSGLETMFAAALVVLSVERAISRAPGSAGTAGVLAILAHPDHALFYAALAVAMGLGRDSRRALPRFLAPFAVIYLPYFVTRWVYYGSFFPNTYHAKSAGTSYFSQGFTYVVVTVVAAGVAAWLPLALAALRVHHRKLFGRFLLIAVPLYLLYVMKIGGDFMHGRLLVVMLPFGAVLVELGARHVMATRRRVLASAGLAFACASVLPVRLIHPHEKFFHIADERSFYPVETLRPLRIDSPYTHWSDRLLDALGTNLRGPLTATGCVGIIGYRTRYPMLDVFGLTDPEVARLPLDERGRPGHEKRAPAAMLLHRNVKLTDQLLFPPAYAQLTEIAPGRIPLHLVRYDRPVVDALRKAGENRFADMDDLLARYQPPAEQPGRFDCDLWFFETYYFSVNDGARDRFLQRLVEEGHLRASQAAFRSAASGSWTAIPTVDFSGVDTKWLRSGAAFADFPAKKPARGQGPIGGTVGPFANSFTAESGDRAEGVVQSPSFRIEGDVITLMVGGGHDSARLRVDLVVDDTAVDTATGCESELLSLRVWDVEAHRNHLARLVITDVQPGSWGHIIVDEVLQWRPR